VLLDRPVRVNDRDVGLDDDELAHYDAHNSKGSAVKVMGAQSRPRLARELDSTVGGKVTIDWTLREIVQAHLRVYARRTPRKHGDSLDKQVEATKSMLGQAGDLTEGWAIAC
jgi:type I restriction enzyme R subunit